jgi:uncharacterized protein YpmB
MNKKMFVSIIVIIIFVVVGVIFFQDKKQEAPSNSQPDNQTPIQEDQQQPKANVLEGTLKTSTDSARGNLMLELLNSDRIIYLRTSRDFSSFVGKDVAVTIDGTIDKFTLVDIQLMSKDGKVKIN